MRRLVACCFATVLLAPMIGAERVAASKVSARESRATSALGIAAPLRQLVVPGSPDGVVPRSPDRVVPGSPDLAVLDRLVFATPLARFRSERSKAKRLHRWLITTTDGCTAPLVGSSGRSFDFRVACERHDLAYANFAHLARLGIGMQWDAALRARVDNQFQLDLQESCLRRRHSERLRCDAWVVVFFHAVRLAAGP